jgi:hypothetical protein
MTMLWVLVLFAHGGPLSDKDSMALTNVPGFASRADCEKAGKESERLGHGTTKVIRWVCVSTEGREK